MTKRMTEGQFKRGFVGVHDGLGHVGAQAGNHPSAPGSAGTACPFGGSRGAHLSTIRSVVLVCGMQIATPFAASSSRIREHSDRSNPSKGVRGFVGKLGVEMTTALTPVRCWAS